MSMTKENPAFDRMMEENRRDDENSFQEYQDSTFQQDVDERVGLTAQDKLAKANITEQYLSTLKSDLEHLMEPITDERGLELVNGGLMRTQKTRKTITTICKAGRESAIKEQRAWIAQKKELVARVTEIEGPLQRVKSVYVAEQERLRLEVEKAAEKKINDRLQVVQDLGFVYHVATNFSPVLYTLNDHEVQVEDITTSTDEHWLLLLEKMQQTAAMNAAEMQRVESERLRVEGIAKAEAERVAEVAKQQAETQANIDAQLKQLATMKKEQRTNSALAIGCQLSDVPEGVETLPETVWNGRLNDLKILVETRNKAAAEKAERDAKEHAEKSERETKERAERDEKIRAEGVAQEARRVAQIAAQEEERNEEERKTKGDAWLVKKAQDQIAFCRAELGKLLSEAISKSATKKIRSYVEGIEAIKN